MPDISMCMDRMCPSRFKCYRYRAKPTQYRQSYSGFKHEGEKCESFSSIEGWDDFTLVPQETLEWQEKTQIKERPS